MSLMRARVLTSLLTAVSLTACEPVDLPPDGGSTRDAGLRDAGLTDSGLADSGVPDAGSTDAGPTDAGATDAGMADAGISFSADVAPIFAMRCAGCHTWTHASLVGQTGSMTACMGQTLVVAGNASSSQLYLKVTNDPSKCGDPMPRGTTGLISTESDKIRAWIQAGAPNN